MQRSISSFSLLLASVSAILGSGWLFATLYTSQLAGPAALLAWLLGGVMVMVIAFVFAELCAMLPITGSSVRIPQYTHGTIVGFLFSWVIWLSYVSCVPAEVQAVLQYLNFFFPIFVQSTGKLTSDGYILATALMLGISTINIYSLRWLIRSNNILTLIKIVIPCMVSLVIILFFFSSHHLFHPANSHFMPLGIKGIFAALTTGGVIFAFNGFKQACEMAGEAKNPNRAIPFAVIGSILVTLLVYLLLQIAFLSSLSMFNLPHGWTHLFLSSGNSPIAAIIQQDHLKFLLPFLYIAAIIGPLAAGLMYLGSSARTLYGISKNNHVPQFFQYLTQKGTPIVAIAISFVLGMCFFAPLPGWDKMIRFLTSLVVLSYGIAPICLLTLRRQLPQLNRPFKLPFATIWAGLAFYICTLMMYWTGWFVISKLTIALVAGLILFLAHRVIFEREKFFDLHWSASLWIWPYFAGLALFSYLGSFGGGKNIIPFGWDFICIGVFCIFIIILALKFKLEPEKTAAYIETLA